MKIAIVVLTVLGFGWNHMLLGAQTATIDVAAADGVFLANTIAGGVGSLANAKSGTPDTNSSPRLKLVVVKTLPYPVINSKTPGAEDIPGGFEGGNTVKVTVRGKSEYHLFAHSYQTLDWSHCQLDHWVSSDGLQWRHDQVLVPPYTDKATGLWTLSCSPMPFFDKEADRWQIYYALFAKPQQSWSPGGTLRCASSKVKGRDGISGPYDFPGEEVLKPGVGYPKTASVSSTCFFTGTSEDDHGFRGIGMVKFKIEEVTDGSPK